MFPPKNTGCTEPTWHDRPTLLAKLKLCVSLLLSDQIFWTSFKGKWMHMVLHYLLSSSCFYIAYCGCFLAPSILNVISDGLISDIFVKLWERREYQMHVIETQLYSYSYHDCVYLKCMRRYMLLTWTDCLLYVTGYFQGERWRWSSIVTYSPEILHWL